MQFKWDGYFKQVGSAIIGCSPEFDLAMYSLCYITRPGKQWVIYVCVCVCMDVRVVCMCVCKDVCVCVCVVVHPVHVYFLRCKLSVGGKPLIIQTYTWDNSSYGNGKKYIGSAFPATP